MKTKNIKVAIFDIDDTLIPRGTQDIIPSAIKAIKELQANGIEVLIATGRSLYFIQDPIHEQIKPQYTVTINGACVYNEKDEVIYDVLMDRNEVEALKAYALQNKLGFGLKMKDAMHIFSGMDTFKSIYLKGSPKEHILLDYEGQELGEELPMGIFMMGDEKTIEASKHLAPNGFYAKAYKDAYDVYSIHAGKIKGIEFVLDRLNSNWNEVIAFGDAHNDMEMLEHARIGVAMGNAPEEVKEKADYVTSSILEDGIEKALKDLELIQA